MMDESDVTGVDQSYDEYVQATVETVDELLQRALNHANTYTEHDDVRPSALLAFDAVEKARMKLDKIDEREFTDD